jgi:site-specific DNA-methyltransferase (adenine-specific)
MAMALRCRACGSKIGRAETGRPPRYCGVACKQRAYRRRQAKARPKPKPKPKPKPGPQHRLAACWSSKTCEWATPQDFFDLLDRRHGPFDLDPAATPENAKCARYYTREQDGLSQPWTGRVFCNPPYGRDIGRWLAKARQSIQSGEAEVVVLLLPARTDTAWWHEYATQGEVTYLKGRLRFGGAESVAPFPSVVLVFRNAREGCPAAPRPAAESVTKPVG